MQAWGQIANRVWQPEERMGRQDLERLQTQRLRSTVERVASVGFYRDAFEAAGGAPRIRGPADVRRLPLTTKEDLRGGYPLGFLATPRERVARYHGSSGTTGKPTFVAYTSDDLATWADVCARFLVAGGLEPGHTCQIAFGYGLFTGGFGLHYGIERVGAAVVPASAGNTERQLLLMEDLGTDVLICTPSYAIHLGEEVMARRGDRRRLRLRFAHLGGEPWTEDMRSRIEQSLGILAFNNYGLSEVMGPGVSGECTRRDGMHIQEDHFLVECLDPVTLEPVPEGEPGELVFTTLTKQAFPLLRYRTRDIAALCREPCACGRTTVRMGRVLGRTDDMLIVRGVNVFPSQIEEALLQVEQAAPHYEILVQRPGALDEMTVRVEVARGSFTDRMSDMQRYRDAITRRVHAVTGLHVAVELLPPGALERFQGKARRVTDRRKLT